MNKKLKKTRIIVLEDEIIVARDIAETLTELGYEVPVYVLTADDAIKKCSELKPDLVLIDIMLNDKMDGTKVAKKIKDTYDIPIVYLSAYSGDKIVKKAKESKPYGYIVKPFDQISLYTTIETALYKHRFERKLVEETENAIAAIIGCTEFLLEESENEFKKETVKKIKMIRNSAEIIKEVIEKL